MHTHRCVLIEISMEIRTLNFWLGLLVTALMKETYFRLKSLKITFFALKMMMIKSSLEKNILKFHEPLQTLRVTMALWSTWTICFSYQKCPWSFFNRLLKWKLYIFFSCSAIINLYSSFIILKLLFQNYLSVIRSFE